MLRLSSESPPAWLELALADIDLVLLDHAHCEKKAASTALNLIFRYPDRSELLLPLSALAREELEHFERVVALIRKRGGEFARLEPSTYAGRLFKVIRKPEPQRLVDTLVVAAFIEARSCERMKLLAEHLEDPELARLYRSLLASEARHHQSYLDLAAHYCSPEELSGRVARVSAFEARLLERVESPIRMHA
jgi:tRNA-(ms[2]io[6]A)-hydroxylase